MDKEHLMQGTRGGKSRQETNVWSRKSNQTVNNLRRSSSALFVQVKMDDVLRVSSGQWWMYSKFTMAEDSSLSFCVGKCRNVSLLLVPTLHQSELLRQQG